MSEDFGAQPHCPQCGTVLADQGSGYRCGYCDLSYLPQQVGSHPIETRFQLKLDLSDDDRYVALVLALEGYASNLEHQAQEEEIENARQGVQAGDPQVESWMQQARTTRTLLEEIEQQLENHGAPSSD